MIFYRAVAWLPFPILYLVAWLAYLVLYYVAGYRKAVVTQNLTRAFPDKSAMEITVLRKNFYRRLSQVVFEIMKSRRMTQEDFQRRAKVRNPELLDELTEGFTKALIILSIHQGNWEWMLHGTTITTGKPMDAIFKPLHNKAADDLIFEIRSRFGCRPIPIANSTKDILRRRKEARLFVMVADQSPIRSERSHWTTFMNQPAAFYLGAETIAKMARIPIAFAQCHRVKTGHYEIEFHKVAEPPYDKDSNEITDRYVELAEHAIRTEPESWLWSNRRWKRDPVAEQAQEESDARENNEQA